MKDPATIRSALLLARASFQTRSSTPALDSQLLLGHILGKSRAWLLSHDEYEIPPAAADDFVGALQQVEQGIALPHLLGYWEFFGRRFFLEEGVLIPRPETELMVEIALNWMSSRAESIKALDIGTGSGVIALSISLENPEVTFIATDISWDVLSTAKQNLRYYQLEERIQLLQCDLAGAIYRSFDLVCANLPYIPHSRLKGLSLGSSEPAIALDGGEDGLDLIRSLLADLPRLLNQDGLALMELDPTQSSLATQVAIEHLPGARIEVKKDLAGLDRLLLVEVKA